MIVLFIIAAFIAVLAFGVYNLQWHFLIAGYNTMAESEKQKVDIKGLSKQVSLLLYATAIGLALMGVASWLELDWAIMLFPIFIIAISLFFSVRSQRYMNGAKQGKTSRKWGLIIGAITLVVVGLILYFSSQPTDVQQTEDGIKINGTYGDTFTWNDMQNVALVQELPAIAMRTNGSAVGSKLKGNFKLENGEKAVLFVDKSNPPFVTFTANDKLYYFNLDDAAQTTALFNTMQQQTQ